MSGCRSSRIDEKQGFPTNDPPRATIAICSSSGPDRVPGAGQGGRARRRGRAVEDLPVGQTLLGAPRDPLKKHKRRQWRGCGVLLYCLTAKKSFAGRRHYSPRLPGGFTLPRRSDGTLGRGPRSEPRAPMQMVSGALGSLGV